MIRKTHVKYEKKARRTKKNRKMSGGEKKRIDYTNDEMTYGLHYEGEVIPGTNIRDGKGKLYYLGELVYDGDWKNIFV